MVRDLVIIGAGPGGIALAAEASASGIDPSQILILEKGPTHNSAIRQLYPEQKLTTANYKGFAARCEGLLCVRDMTKPETLQFFDKIISDYRINIQYLIDRYAQAAGKKFRTIDKGTLELFQTYDWPGNVRELQNVIERAVILSDGETFCVDETWLTPVTPKTAASSVPLVANLIDHEKEMIETALREAEGLISGPTGAATKLGIPRQTLESKIRKLGINRHRFKTT